jgi:phosphoribosylformylglycinamidine cyclo-ligase
VSRAKGVAERSAYAASGVDVDAGERAVELMRTSVASTQRPEILGGLGGFGSAFAIPAGYREPVIVSSTDGVGTKTAIAQAMGRYDTIGIDLVAMCADDVACTGAEPVAFLDYIAIGKVEPERVATLVAGIAEGCRQAGAALVGGETAEHPGLMEPDEFDLAGFCIGVGERSRLLDGSAAQAGDVIVGLASSGLHANGYSLVRRVVADARLAYDQPWGGIACRALGCSMSGLALLESPELIDATLGDVLLVPTRVYAKDLLALRAQLAAAGHEVRGFAHITGGGLPGNVPRALPDHLGARIHLGSWRMPAVFSVLGVLGSVDHMELRATFNAGIGMIAVVPAEAGTAAVEAATGLGVDAWVIGDVVDAGTLGARYVEIESRPEPIGEAGR